MIYIKKGYKTVLLSFVFPFLIILVTITVSNILVNYLKDIQKDSIIAIYQWEKVTSYAEDRYWFKSNTNFEIYNKLIDDFETSIYGLKDVLPKWILGDSVTQDITTSISLWDYIKTLLSKNETVYNDLMNTELGKYLMDNKFSKIIIDTYTKKGELPKDNFLGYYLYNKLETDFDIVMNFINTESIFETKLLSLHNAIGDIVSLLIKIIILLAVLITILVMVSVRTYIKNVLSEQKKSEDSLSQILNSIGDGMIVTSVDQRIIRMNPVAELLLGVKFEDLKGEKLLNLIKFKFNNSKEYIDPVSEVLKSKKAVIFSDDLIIENIHGEKMNISSSASPIIDLDKKISGMVLVFKDISIRKKQEYELIQNKENLEILVKQRTDKLQESLDQLKETQHQLVESEKMSSLAGLVAGVAHEINTPVGIAVTAASYLENETDEFDSLYNSNRLSKTAMAQFLENINTSSKMILSNLKRAAQLINSFKQVAVDQSSEEIREFLIYEYVNEILVSTNSKFKHTTHSVTVNSNNEFRVKSYPGALSQVITNLLLNSLIHGFENIENGKITIDLEKQGDLAVIEYKDTGNGIPAENLTKIFDPFFTTKRGIGGSGLGMNIVYNLVTQTLKGDIKCSSRPGDGTTFFIRFPHNM